MHFMSAFLLGFTASEAWAAPQDFLDASGGVTVVPLCAWTVMPVTAETEFRVGEAELLSWTGTSSPVSGCSLTDSATYTQYV